MLKSKQINRIAMRCKRELKGKTDFVSVEEYLNNIGYKVIFSILLRVIRSLPVIT